MVQRAAIVSIVTTQKVEIVSIVLGKFSVSVFSGRSLQCQHCGTLRVIPDVSALVNVTSCNVFFVLFPERLKV